MRTRFISMSPTNNRCAMRRARSAKNSGTSTRSSTTRAFNRESAQTANTPSTLAPGVLRSVYETNFFGAFSVLQNFIPLLLKSEAPRVVNVSSTLGSLTELSNPDSPYYGVNAVAYNSSKAALNALTVAFAKEFKDTPLKINSACPGWVKTDLGGEQAPRELEEGPRIFVTLATLPADGPSGGFFDENGPVAW